MRTRNLFLTLGSFLLAWHLAAATYHVSTTGNDSSGNGSLANPWRTIRKGAIALNPGDTLLIRGGVYTDSLRGDDWHSGTSGARVTVRNYPGETVTVNLPAGSQRGWSIEEAKFINLEGIRLNATEVTSGPALKITTPRAGGVDLFLRFTNCVFANSPYSHGVLITRAHETIFDNCTFQSNGWHWIGGPTDPGSPAHGIYVGEDAGKVTLQSCQALDNGDHTSPPDNESWGFHMYGGGYMTNCIIRDSVAARNCKGGILFSAPSRADNRGTNWVVNSISVSNLQYGIGVMYGGVGVRIVNCTAARNGNTGLIFDDQGGTEAWVVNNIIANNGRGIRFESSAVGAGSSCFTSNNLVCDNSNGNNWSGAPSAGAVVQSANLVGNSYDADFANLGANDVRILTTSDAVGAGVSLANWFTVDRAGTRRPQGAAWDLGAYQASAPAGGPPTIQGLSDRSTVAVQPVVVTFTVGDPDTSLNALSLSATSSDTGLVPSENIVFGGSGANRTATITAAVGRAGTSRITLSVSDGTQSASSSFTLAVTLPNQPPTISALADQSYVQGTTPTTVAFTVADPDQAAGTLSLSAASSNPGFLPATSVRFGGAGADRTLTIDPLPSQAGSSTLTITVSDGSATANATFRLAVTAAPPPNTPPSITSVADQTLAEDTWLPELGFTIGDAETAVRDLQVTARSSNTSLVADSQILLSGADARRTLTVIPQPDQYGATTISLTVSDGSATSTTRFTLTVQPVNDAPVIADVPDQVSTLAFASLAVAVPISDVDDDVTGLSLTATSSDPELLPAEALQLEGTGAQRRLTIAPLPGAEGRFTVTLALRDGESETRQSLLLVMLAAGASTDRLTAVTTDGSAPIVDFTSTDYGKLVQWESTPGQSYQVYGKSSSSKQGWVPLSDVITAIGPVTAWADVAITGAAQRFYTVRRVN